MTIARNHHLFFNQSTYFHLISRCVRRAFLCGKDKYTGKRYDHRKRWLEKRLFELCELFYIDLYGYAILSNHYHLVVQTRPDQMQSCSDAQVARRWCRVFPNQQVDESCRITELLKEPEKIERYRQRLCDISWLMRCLNEGMARLANKEDRCNGRFWQGRFRSQLLLDESAVYACMAYVDLNPVRAGLARTPEQSMFTSIRYRLNHHQVNQPLRPLNKSHNSLSMMLSDYLILIDETGRCIRDDKSGYILNKARPILKRIGLREEGFIDLSKSLSKAVYRGIGSIESCRQLADDLGLNWLKGQQQAQRLYWS